MQNLSNALSFFPRRSVPAALTACIPSAAAGNFSILVFSSVSVMVLNTPNILGDIGRDEWGLSQGNEREMTPAVQ